MKVVVQYSAQARQFAGIAMEEVELRDESTVRQLIQSISSRNNPALRSMLLGEDGQPRQSYLVFVGDRCVHGDASEPLRDGDRVAIMSMISGG